MAFKWTGRWFGASGGTRRLAGQAGEQLVKPGSEGEPTSTAADDEPTAAADPATNERDAAGAEPATEEANGWPTWEKAETVADEDESPATAAVVLSPAAGSTAATAGSKARIDEVLAFIDEPARRRRRPLFIAAAVFLVAAAILAAAVIPGLRDDSADVLAAEQLEPTPAQAVPTAIEVPTATVVPTTPPVPTATAVPTPTPAPTATAVPTPTPVPTATAVPTEIPVVDPEPDPGEDPAEVAGAQVTSTPGVSGNQDEVPESKAVVLGGKIYLEGAVPDEASAQAIVELAAAVLGPDNVINNYIIDERAGDPNLGNIRVDDTVLFETNSAVIATEFEPLLGQALALMSLRPSVTLTIVGHTDSVGPDAYNLGLSIQRAQAVVAWLTERGVDPARLTAVGAGEAEPIATNDTLEGRQLNRRIQVFIENLLAS